jgi:hypothetical protein
LLILLISLAGGVAYLCPHKIPYMKTIIQKNITVELTDENILHIHIHAYTEVTLSDAVLALEAMEKLSEGKKHPVLIDAGEFSSVDKEVREFSASPESNAFTLADAIAYDNIGQKIVANFYISQNRPVVPTRMFSEKEEALKWLRTFLK